MKTLLERLKPTYHAKLMANADLYPSLAERMIKTLSELHSIHDLKIGDASSLVSLCDASIAGIYDLFYTIGEQDND